MEAEEECPQSLWSLIVSHVPESELQEIRGILGDALIDMFTEIHSEVEMWRQIWRGVRNSAGHRGNRAATPCLTLADSPAVKELLRGQVQLLLLSVRERAATLGRDRETALTRYHPAVVKYALGNRPGNHDGCGPDNRQCEAEEQPSSRATVSPCQQGRLSLALCGCQENELETVKDKLNLADIHQVVLHLQLVLREECEGLKRQVVSLQESIEQEYRTQHDPDLHEPSVAELREQRRILQKDLEHHRLFLTSSPSLQDETIQSRSMPRGVKPAAESPRPSTPPRAAKPRPPPTPPAHARARPPIGHPLELRGLCPALAKPRSAPPPPRPIDNDDQPGRSPAGRDGPPVQSQSAGELRTLHTQRVALRCPNASDGGRGGGGGGGVSSPGPPGRLPPVGSSGSDVTDSAGTEERGARSHGGRRRRSDRVRNADHSALATEVTPSPTPHEERSVRTVGRQGGVRDPEGGRTQRLNSTFTGHCTKPLYHLRSPTSSPDGLLLQPAPPAVPRPASRGQARSRRLGRAFEDRVPNLV